MNVIQFAGRFQGARQAGAGFLVRCPAHDDQRSSLSIGEGQNGGIVMYCHAGCSTQAILDALGMQMSDLAPERPPQASRSTGQQRASIVKTYDYKLVDGTLSYQVVRKSDKTFLQRRPDGNGGWIWKIAKSVKRVPYRLPELLGKSTVYIVEGEKDADNLWSIGLPATCNSGGAGKWGASETKALKNAGCVRVIILPDNDGPGVNHANEVAGRCRSAGMSVSIIPLPGLAEHGDVSDWLSQGHSRVDLEEIVSGTPYVVPPPAQPYQTAQDASGLLTDQDAGLTPDDAPAVSVAETPADPDALPDPTKYAPPGSDGIPYDVGAGEAFRDRFGDRIRFDHSQQRWLIWSGHYWRPDDDGAIWRLAKRHVDLWQAEAMRARAYVHRKNLVNYCLQLDKRSRLELMVKCAASEEPISTSGAQWDSNHWLLGVQNGVVDLKTGELRDGRRDDWITKQAGCAFDPDAQCPRWLQFLNEVMCDDAAMVDYIHRALGYSLTGDMREQAFFLAVGGGSNGKSLFLDTLEHVWGAYGHRANMRIFIGPDGSDKFHLAELEGRRLIFASETKPGQRMNEHVVKNFTGGESQSADRKFGQPFTFKPIGKIWLGVNHHPRIADDSFGFWRRVRIVEFLQTFTGASDDRGLKAKLQQEAAGILAWAVRGCLLWQESGLGTPPRVANAVDEYQQNEDPLREFLVECCTFDNPDAVTSFAAIYAAYDDWCKLVRIDPRHKMSRRGMGENLKRRLATADANGVRRYRGIEIRPTKIVAGTMDFEDYPAPSTRESRTEDAPDERNWIDSVDDVDD